MVKTCVAYGCSNTHKNGVTLHKCPNPNTEKGRYSEWIRQVKRTRQDFQGPPLPYKSPGWQSCVLCSDHFSKDCFENINSFAISLGYKSQPKLKPDAIPTIFKRKPAASETPKPSKSANKASSSSPSLTLPVVAGSTGIVRNAAAKLERQRENTLTFLQAFLKTFMII